MKNKKQNPYADQKTATVSTRVTDEEYQELEWLAQRRGQKMSEWVREVLLNQLGEPEGHEVVLAEVMALRTIVLNLTAAQVQGERVSEERIREIIRRADKDRFEQASKKWIDAANHWMGQGPGQVKSNGRE